MATITYRDATGLDVSNIFRLFRAAEELIEIPHALLDPQRAVAYISACLVDGVVKVADLSGRIVGAGVGMPIREQWTNIWFLRVPFLVVDPHFRRHGVAQYLIKATRDWAEDKRLPVQFEATTGGKKALLRDRFIAMQGLAYQGGRFLAWPKDVPPR